MSITESAFQEILGIQNNNIFHRIYTKYFTCCRFYRFLGELVNLARLFNHPDDAESSIEQICVLLTTSGKALELLIVTFGFANALLHSISQYFFIEITKKEIIF